MNRSMLMVVMMAALAVVCVGTAVAADVPASQPAIGGSATPKDALVRLSDGFHKMDVDLIVGAVAPDYQPAMRTMMTAMKPVAAKVESVKKTTTDKLGAEVANKLFKDMNFAGQGPLSEITKDGQVDWEKVKITETGDKATVEVNGTVEEDLVLKKIDGKWYVLPGNESADALNKQAGQAAKMMAAMVKAMDAFETAVKEGKVTAENAEQEWGKALMAAMMGAAAENGNAGNSEE